MSSPEKYKRNEHGLLESVDYVFNNDGSVNWRAMISSEHLYPNKDWFERRKMPVPSSIEGLDDGQLLIKLSGIKELAKLRGFHNVTYDVSESSDSRVVVQCMISWIDNYESNGTQTFASIANATTNNTNGFAAKFLECIAENRAFIRCVRNFLNIHIVGADEIDSSKDKAVRPAVAWFHRVLGHPGPNRLFDAMRRYFHPDLRGIIDSSKFDACQRYKTDGRGWGHLVP